MRVPSVTNFCKILIVAFLLAGLHSYAQSCGSGDCQPGVIAGPYSAPQTSENTAANFPVCTSASCRASAWVNDQIEGIDAQQNIGTAYQFSITCSTLIPTSPWEKARQARMRRCCNG